MQAIKPEIRIVKDKYGRRIVGYSAQFGELSREGKTPAEAVAALEDALRPLTEFRNSLPTLIPLAGYVVIVTRSTEGDWRYQLIAPNAKVQSASHCGHPNREAAENSARDHVAQLLYPDPIAREIAADKLSFDSWAEFQNRYREAKAANFSDKDAWDFAARNPAGYKYLPLSEAK